MTVLVALAANKPVVGALCLAGNCDIVGWLCLEILRVVPVARHILDELESVHILGIVLGKVGSHLQRTVHRDIKRQRAGNSYASPRGVVAPRIQLCLEDSRGIVHRTALQTGERQDAGVVGTRASECLVLCSARALVAHEVRIGAADARRTRRLMRVNHDVMLRRLLDDIEVMIVHRLRVMVVATRDDVAYIACLHGVITVLVHQFVGLLYVTLVVLR